MCNEGGALVGPQQAQAGVLTLAQAFGLGLGNTYANEESKSVLRPLHSVHQEEQECP